MNRFGSSNDFCIEGLGDRLVSEADPKDRNVAEQFMDKAKDILREPKMITEYGLD